jgi:hypothetical protein
MAIRQRFTLVCIALCSTGFALAARQSVAQQGAGVLVGRVQDASSRAPVADVVVTVSGNQLQGEDIVVTDASGVFRFSHLPPGEFTLRFEREDYRPLVQEAIALRADSTIKIESLMMPEVLHGEQIVVVAEPPSVDIGSPTVGMNVSDSLSRRVPLIEPGSRGGAVRSFESSATATPGVRSDDYGVSINGTTSPENQYVIDGLTVNSAQLGVNSVPLSTEFVRELNVMSGGYLPEYGRSTGGVLSVVTKQGSNEFHGGAWMHTSPAFLSGARKTLKSRGSSIETTSTIDHVSDIGGEIGGPLIHDKLWFYAGFIYATTRYKATRALRANALGSDGSPQLDETGAEVGNIIPGSEQTYAAVMNEMQMFGKLTYTVNPRVRTSLSAYYLPSSSGGDGKFAIDHLTAQPRFGFGATRDDTAIAGPYSALAREHRVRTFGILAKVSAETHDKRVMLDTSIGWQTEQNADRAGDGTRVGSGMGFAGLPTVEWRRNTPGYHPVSDFETVPAGSPCEAAGASEAVKCPAQIYHSGGPSYLYERTFSRTQLRSVATFLFDGLGKHIAKAGIEGEVLVLDDARGYSGGHVLRESDDGSSFDDSRNYGVTTSPDNFRLSSVLRYRTSTITAGGFLQDSWSVLDTLTLTAGVRYDAQYLFGGQGALTMALPNQWSPRIGAIFDPIGNGKAKIFAHYARYYESVPLQVVNRTGSSEPSAYVSRPSSACDPRDAKQLSGACSAPETRSTLGGPTSADRSFVALTGGRTPVDPDLAPQSSDEIVLGAEADVVRRGRVGISYTRRWMNRVIEDLSRDEAQSYFIANPGYGAARDFPVATRNYDALTAFFQKGFDGSWVAQASYTLSYLRGNYAGLYRPETLQIDPNMNSDFDLRSLTVNREGPLPADHRHSLKIFGAKDLELSKSFRLVLGGAARAESGGPTNYLGTHPLYGLNEVFVLRRGSGERLPWVGAVDAHIGLSYELPGGQTIGLTTDIFNLFGLQGVTSRDERYTSSDVVPVTSAPGGVAVIKKNNGDLLTAEEVNPNFGQPTAFQAPRRFRIGVRATF